MPTTSSEHLESVEHFLEVNLGADEKAWIAEGIWLDRRGLTIRINGPDAVLLVSPFQSLRSALDELARPDLSGAAIERAVPDANARTYPGLEERRHGWPDGGGLGIGGDYDMMYLAYRGQISLDVAEWFGMHLAEAIAIVVIESGARSSRYLKPVQPSKLLRRVLYREGRSSGSPQPRAEAPARRVRNSS